MFEVQILIPVVDNDGEAFSAEHHRVFEGEAVDRFGGFTLYPVETVGGWRNEEGRLFVDRSRVYAVAVQTIADGGKVADLVIFARSHYRQEAIFLRYLGQAEIL